MRFAKQIAGIVKSIDGQIAWIATQFFLMTLGGIGLVAYLGNLSSVIVIVFSLALLFLIWFLIYKMLEGLAARRIDKTNSLLRGE